MTSSNGDVFCVTGPLCGEFPGHRWIPHTKADDAELWCFLWSAPWINGWLNNREAGDLRRYRVHYVIVIRRWMHQGVAHSTITKTESRSDEVTNPIIYRPEFTHTIHPVLWFATVLYRPISPMSCIHRVILLHMGQPCHGWMTIQFSPIYHVLI